MPHRVELSANDGVEGTEIGVFDAEFVKVELCGCFESEVSGNFRVATAHVGIASLEFRQSRRHTLYDCLMDISHPWRHRHV